MHLSLAVRGWRVIAAVLTLTCAAPGAQVTFTGLGTNPIYTFTPTAISADGTTIVGGNTGFGAQSARWTRSSGTITQAGSLGGGFAAANGVSANGTIVVGQAATGAGANRAYRWTQGGSTTNLGVLSGGNFSAAYATSSNGSVVVGDSNKANGHTFAFRWTQSGGMVSLGTLPGGTDSWARGVSANGTVVVGSATDSTGNMQAFRWVQGSGMVGLSPGASSFATAVSSDGSVVVGQIQGDTSMGTFRWTTATGLRTLAMGADDYFATAAAVSADGRLTIGSRSNALLMNDVAVFWDGNGAAQDLQTALATEGINLTGWTLTALYGAAGTDNSYSLAGVGIHNGQTEAFLVSNFSIPAASAIPEPADYAALAGGTLAVFALYRRRTATPSTSVPSRAAYVDGSGMAVPVTESVPLV